MKNIFAYFVVCYVFCCPKMIVKIAKIEHWINMKITGYTVSHMHGYYGHHENWQCRKGIIGDELKFKDGQGIAFKKFFKITKISFQSLHYQAQNAKYNIIISFNMPKLNKTKISKSIAWYEHFSFFHPFHLYLIFMHSYSIWVFKRCFKMNSISLLKFSRKRLKWHRYSKKDVLLFDFDNMNEKKYTKSHM